MALVSKWQSCKGQSETLHWLPNNLHLLCPSHLTLLCQLHSNKVCENERNSISILLLSVVAHKVPTYLKQCISGVHCNVWPLCLIPGIVLFDELTALKAAPAISLFLLLLTALPFSPSNNEYINIHEGLELMVNCGSIVGGRGGVHIFKWILIYKREHCEHTA